VQSLECGSIDCVHFCWRSPFTPTSRHAQSLEIAPRYLVSYLFSILYLALLVILEARLGDWNDEEPGNCYNPYLTTSTSARHPTADKAYVATTGIWMLSSVLLATFDSAKNIRSVLGFALLQFPVHVYMLVTLRTANQELVEGEKQENEWGFGQTVAIVLLLDTAISCVAGLKGQLLGDPFPQNMKLTSNVNPEYYDFEREGGSQVTNVSHDLENHLVSKS
jgi:hypothetical protein